MHASNRIGIVLADVYAQLLPYLARECLQLRLPVLDVTAGQVPDIRVPLPGRAAMDEQHLARPHRAAATT